MNTEIKRIEDAIPKKEPDEQKELKAEEDENLNKTAMNLPPPREFSIEGNINEDWKEWRLQFMNYLIATKLHKDSEESQCAVLLHVIGNSAVRAYRQFNFENEEDKKKINIVLDKFEEYFVPQINETVERYKFNSRIQSADETVDQFITDLRAKAKTCGFDKLEDSFIRDRIVIGIRSDAVRDRLLREKKLTLNTAVEICRADEQSRIRHQEIAVKKEVDGIRRDFKKTEQKNTTSSWNRNVQPSQQQQQQQNSGPSSY